MQLHHLLKYCSIGFLLVCQTSALTPAVLNSAGTVRVNGNYAPATTAVFEGDRIQTTSNSVAALSMHKTLIDIQNASVVLFGNESVAVLSGSAKVKTSRRYSAFVDGISVRPNTTRAEYLMVVQGDKVYIAALNGDLLIGGSLRVPSGNSVIVAVSPVNAKPQNTTCIDEKKADENARLLLSSTGEFISCTNRKRPGALLGTTGSAVAAKTRTLLILGSAVATGGAASGYVAYHDKPPASPTIP